MAVRHRVGLCTIILLAVFALNYYAGDHFSSSLRAKLIRAQMVVIFEIVIFLGTRYIWSHVTTALPNPNNSSHHDTMYNYTSNTTYVRGSIGKLLFQRLYPKILRKCTLIFLGLCLLTYPVGIMLVAEEPYLITIICYSCLGAFIQLIVCLFVINRILDILRYATRYRLPIRSRNRIALGIPTMYLLIAVPFGVYFAMQPPMIKFEQVPISGLPEELDGFKFVHISDVHLGPTVGRSKFARIVDLVNQQKPDAVAMVGDFVDSPLHLLHKSAEPVRDIKAPKGVYFVSGNHEYHTADVDAWFAHWRSLGVTVLHNEHAMIHADAQPAAQFCVAGTDDVDAEGLGYTGHGMDLDKAVQGCKPGSPIVLLAHQPKGAKRAMDSKYNIQLVLSGHTHGGQIFPVHILVYLLNPFYAGLYPYKHGHVYVSQGSVYWGIPMRIGSQHEITVIILRSKHSQNVA